MATIKDLDSKNILDIDLKNYVGNTLADLSPKDVLSYYQEIGKNENKTMVIGITDKNDVSTSIAALKEYKFHPKKYENLIYVPGVELEVNLDDVFSYISKDKKHSIFNDYSILAYADNKHYKNWVNNKELTSFSNITSLKVKKAEGNSRTINIGYQVLAARNIIKHDYNITIPFSELSSCVKENTTYSKTKAKFDNIVIKNLKKSTNKNLQNKTLGDLKNILETITSDAFSRNTKQPTKTSKIIKNGSYKLDLHDANDILTSAQAHICYTNQCLLKLNDNNKMIPLNMFAGVDLLFLKDTAARLTIEEKLSRRAPHSNEFVDSSLLDSDEYGLVKLGLLHVNAKRNGINVEGLEINNTIMHNDKKLKATLQFCEVYNLEPSFGTGNRISKLHNDVLNWRDGKINDQKLLNRAQCYFNNNLIENEKSEDFIPLRDFMMPHELLADDQTRIVESFDVVKNKFNRLDGKEKLCVNKITECGFLNKLFNKETKINFKYNDREILVAKDDKKLNKIIQRVIIKKCNIKENENER